MSELIIHWNCFMVDECHLCLVERHTKCNCITMWQELIQHILLKCICRISENYITSLTNTWWKWKICAKWHLCDKQLWCVMRPSPIFSVDKGREMSFFLYLDAEWVTNTFLLDLMLQSAEQRFLLSPCTKTALQSQDILNVKHVHFFGH